MGKRQTKSGRPRLAEETARVTVRMPVGMVRELEKMAAGRAVGEVVRRAVEMMLRGEVEVKPKRGGELKAAPKQVVKIPVSAEDVGATAEQVELARKVEARVGSAVEDVSPVGILQRSEDVERKSFLKEPKGRKK